MYVLEKKIKSSDLRIRVKNNRTELWDMKKLIKIRTKINKVETRKQQRGSTKLKEGALKIWIKYTNV